MKSITFNRLEYFLFTNFRNLQSCSLFTIDLNAQELFKESESGKVITPLFLVKKA
jgi:hypothetical protein